MPQKFLSIKNFEKYQTTSKYPKAWIKLHRAILGDPQFLKLTPSYRFLYIGLLILADECNNRIYNDSTYLIQRLYISPTDLLHITYTPQTEGVQKTYKAYTELDLRPLYRAGFLIASNLSRVLSEKRREEKNRVEESADTEPASPPTPTSRKKPLTEWPEGFQFNDRHQSIADGLGLNVHAEFIKFKDKAMSKGWTYKDWDAAFRTWINNASDFKQARTR